MLGEDVEDQHGPIDDLQVGLVGDRSRLRSRQLRVADEELYVLLEGTNENLAELSGTEERARVGHRSALLDKLDQLGIADSTIVIYTTDNGVEKFFWPDGGTAPFRSEKNSNWEGGFRVPLLVRWPGVIKPGVITKQVGHIIDITPTFMDITGAEYPTERNGQTLKKPFGKSLLPIFQGKERKPHDALYWAFGRVKAVRVGDWKLVRFGNADWELYNMAYDKTETNNVASANPDKVKKLSGMWETWMKNAKKK